MSDKSGLIIVSSLIILVLIIGYSVYTWTFVPNFGVSDLDIEIVTEKERYVLGEEILASVFLVNKHPTGARLKPICFNLIGYSARANPAPRSESTIIFQRHGFSVRELLIERHDQKAINYYPFCRVIASPDQAPIGIPNLEIGVVVGMIAFHFESNYFADFELWLTRARGGCV